MSTLKIKEENIMIINHNLAALNANRNMNINSTNASKSMQKLSSGLRINSAADDAAGLAISEKMRGQIRGLDQASSNAQDGISMIQTAEGALNETQSIIQRMRELSVQGANGTATDDDRKSMQAEMSQLNSEIDRIGDTTEFNTKKLLNGSQNQQTTLVSTTSKILSADIVNPMAEDTYNIAVTAASEVATDVVAGPTGLAVDGSTLTVTADGTKIDVGTKFTLKVEDGGTSDHKVTLTDADGNTFGAAVDNNDLSGAITFTAGSESIVVGAGALTANGTATFTIGEKASMSLTDSSNNVVASVTNQVTTDGNIDVGGVRVNVDQSLTNVAAAGGDTVKVEGEALKFQIGANETQTTTLAIRDMRSDKLGIADIDLSTRSGSSSAISTLDTALKTVSEERGKLGALQNRLEHTINNLGTSSENLTSAESRIRDVDMAKEMSTFSKNNILSQAAQAMLAQANSMPQQVLQLLK
jgi:flagellin